MADEADQSCRTRRHDRLARTLSEKLTTALGQPVVVENKPGAGGGVGAEFIRARCAGWLHDHGWHHQHACDQCVTLFELPYDPVKDFVAITLIARVPNLLVINPSLPANNVAELICS